MCKFVYSVVMFYSVNQYPPGHGATEVIDENLSENDGEENLRKLKEADQINEDKYKHIDNKLREEKEAEIILDQNEGEEKHLAEQQIKEKIEYKDKDGKADEEKQERYEDLAKLDTQLKGILKTSDSKQNLKDTDVGGIVQIVTSEPAKPDVKVTLVDRPSASKADGATAKPSRTLPQIDQIGVNRITADRVLGPRGSARESEGSGILVSATSNESAPPKTHSVKQLVKSFEMVGKDTLDIPKAFSVPEYMNEKDRNISTGGGTRRQSEPTCNIVEDSYPEHLISRAPLTFAIAQTDDKTHTMGDDNVDENATRAAPFTQASQWQAVSGFASSTENSENEDDAEEVIGADGKVHKSTTKTKGKVNFMNTLADEDDLKLDSLARTSVYFDDKDSSKALRSSLIFVDDDIEGSPQEQLGMFIREKVEEKSYGVDSRDVSFPFVVSEKSKASRADKSEREGLMSISQYSVSQPSVGPIIPHAFTVPSKLSEKFSDSEKLSKDIGNRMNKPIKYPPSPSKSSLKDKDSLSEVKKLAVLNNLKLSGFGKLSSSTLRKERSSDSLDKILKEKKPSSENNSPSGSPAKSRHLLKPIDLMLKEKTKSDGDIAGSERRSRSRSREGKDRGRSSSRSEDKTKRRQSLTTIEENTRSQTPGVSPLEEQVLNNNLVPSASDSFNNDTQIAKSKSSAGNKEKTTKSKEEMKSPEEKEKRERKERKRSSSAPRNEKQENQRNLEPVLPSPVPPLDLNQKVPKPPAPGSAPKKNLVYSAR